MAKLTTDEALCSLLIYDVYIWAWFKAGLTKDYRRKMRNRLHRESISADLKQELLLKCGYIMVKAASWSHLDYRCSTGLTYSTDEAFTILTSSAYLWLSTKRTAESRRYYLHCVRTDKSVSLSLKIKLLAAAGFVMQPPKWHYPIWQSRATNKALSIKNVTLKNRF